MPAIIGSGSAADAGAGATRLLGRGKWLRDACHAPYGSLLKGVKHKDPLALMRADAAMAAQHTTESATNECSSSFPPALVLLLLNINRTRLLMPPSRNC